MSDVRWRLRRVSRAARAAAVALLAAAAACDGGVPTESDLGQLAGGDGRQAETQLDGRIIGGWSRILFFDDVGGGVVVNETRFDFRADGRFSRLQITSDFGSGFGDQFASQGTWATRGGTLILTYETPTFRTEELPYRLESTIDGPRLFIDGLLYVQTATGL